MERDTVGAPVRVSLVGAGAWARTAHLPALAARDDVILTSVLDADPERGEAAAREYGFARVAGSFDELLGDGADACIVASPAVAHAQQAIALLEGGRHVLLEKPMTNSAESAWAVAEAATRAERHVLLALGWNYSPVFAQARALLEAQPLGRLDHVVLHMASGLVPLLSGESSDSSGRPEVPAVPATWRDPAVSGGGYGNAQLSHALGLMFGLVDDAIDHAHVTLREGPHPGIELGVALAGVLRSGATLAVSGIAFRPPVRQHLDLRVYGHDGFIEVDVLAERVRRVRADGTSTTAELPVGAGIYQGTAPAHAFIDLVRGVRPDNLSDAVVGARSTEVLDIVRAAAA
ncbi:MAG TPA: Gfo/Idh/MocA family oxidoreductase [Protaetiibacter sp.]|nr:Gfo/Idh/MocA family oxidoreductase [Protaetiibacter sp.]